MAAKSKVNAAGNYTQPGMRKSLFEEIISIFVNHKNQIKWHRK